MLENSVLGEVVSVIGFPAGSYGVQNWFFDWSYGVAWFVVYF
jgi:hypothetical protein